MSELRIVSITCTSCGTARDLGPDDYYGQFAFEHAEEVGHGEFYLEEEQAVREHTESQS
jgi:hypothetical protein